MKKIVLPLALCFLILTPTCCVKKSANSQQLSTPTVVHKAHLPKDWYAHDPDRLHAELDAYLAQAEQNFSLSNVTSSSVRALIVPHASHFYSGLCAAAAYQALRENHAKNQTIKRVIILAPSHFTLFHGISLPSYTDYQTPLGRIHVDEKAIKMLTSCNQFHRVPEAHEPEHSLEIQLPFLQKTIADFSLVPLVVGDIREEAYSEICNQLGKIIDNNTLVVVSSDFVHHGKDYQYQLFDRDILDHIRQIDSMALQAIFAQSFGQFAYCLHETDATICGREPIKLLLALLQKNKIKKVNGHLCCSYTSAHLEQARKRSQETIDIAKLMQLVPDAQAQRSVSYASVIFAQPARESLESKDSLTGYEKKALLACSRATLENIVKPEDLQKPDQLIVPIASPGLLAQSGAFVTLNKKSGELRGCIGRITRSDPLFQTVMAMTYAAALHDTRFTPVQANELDNLIIDISILTPPTPIKSYQDIVIGKHGIILNKFDAKKKKTHSAAFLPQVPVEWQWNLQTTLEQLAQKAGLSKDEWKKNCSFEVFEGFEIKE